ncbi:MAG: C40 family peptidase [Burkholderiaceae bacterium]|jgi:cell wall-associated NlpC family hydrolase|nr:C40 family peptidase [Burkholderiaceae bacterium]
MNAGPGDRRSPGWLWLMLLVVVLSLNACSVFSPASKTPSREPSAISVRLPEDGSLGSQIAIEAYWQLGAPYVLGGETPEKGFDCSGLAYYVYQLHGVTIPRTSLEQSRFGKLVNTNALKPGDLLFFSKGAGAVNHVGIFLGDDAFIHALNPDQGVLVTRFSTRTTYGKGIPFRLPSRYHHARRVVP